MANEIVEACREGDLEKVKNLVEQCDVNPKDPQWKDAGKTPLHWASHYGRLEVVKYLVENCKCDPMCKDAEYGKTPLHWASHYGRLEVMKYLVASLRCDPMCKDDKWGNTPLHWAARFATLEAVKYLVDDCNCDVMCTNNQNNSPLNDAALGGNLEVVRFLITEKKCDPRVTGRWGRTPLHYACEVSSIAVVKFLLEESGYKEPSCRDDIGLTPLHVAASQGSLDIVKYLIEEQKCKIECKDDHDETPLHEAIKGGRFGIMKYLIRNGCDPMRGGKSGGTALHHACQHGRVEEVKHLIAHNNLAIDSPCNNSGASPLHVAAANGRLDIVKLLVETFLCELNVQDSNKQTPLELAQEKGEDEIASYLSDLDKKSNLRSTLLKQLRPRTKQAIPTGTELGSGAYGSVIELTCEGKTVAGKIFRTMSRDHKIAVQESIKDELDAMMEVEHPNIVQTMGVCFLPNEPLPVLLMERMEYNLHSYLLDPKHFSLPIQTKLSILCDIASGLTCLHNHKPPIIHRDLTANNVLLDKELRAKIADFGNSQILSSQSKSMIHGTFTSLQQSREYNPFEGYEESRPSLDVFQFGHLALFTTIQTPVRPLRPPNYIDEETGELHAHSEVERRQHFVEKAKKLLSSNHSLVKLIKQCLHNNPEERPCTEKLMPTLQIIATTGGQVSPFQASFSSIPADDDSHYQESAVDTSMEKQTTDSAKTEVMRKKTILPNTSMEKQTTDSAKTEVMRKEEKTILPNTSMEKQTTDSAKTEVMRKKTILPSYLRGVDVFGETSVMVTNKSQTFHWTGYGLKIHIPQGALPDSLEDCRLLLKVGLSGQFALPENTSLVSAVYWLDSEPQCKFSQPLTLEIQHCAKSSQISRLNFILAKCSQGNLPYTFETLEGGKFSSQSAYGCIQLYHFSLITLVKRLLVGEDSIRYRASLYFLKKGEYQREIHFVITKDQEAHATKVRQEYTAKGATIGPDLKIEFQSSSISLQLPSEGVTLQDGWRIIPFFHPGITKEDVDNFETGSRIPSCQLTAVWTKKSKPPGLIHKVTLEGAKEPFNYFSIILDCDSTPPDSDPTSRFIQDQDLHSKYAGSLNSEPELLDLMNEVAAEIPGKWRDIGLQLGLDQGRLDGIATISPGDNNHCYSNVFTLWKKHNLPKHPYTWLTIVQALQSKAVGEKRLAEKIRNALIGPQSL